MKDLGLLIWLTQLGISVVAPLAGYTLLAAWLCRRFGWNRWVIVIGIVLGISGAVGGLRDALKSMDKYIQRKSPKKPSTPPVGFCDHD